MLRAVVEATIEADATSPRASGDPQEWSEQPQDMSSTMDSNNANGDDEGFDHKAWVEQAVQAKGVVWHHTPKGRGQKASHKGHAKRKGLAGVYAVAPAEEEGEDWRARWLAQDQDSRHNGASHRHIQRPRPGSRGASLRYMATAEEDGQDRAERDTDTGAGTQVGHRRARSIRRRLQEEAEADDRTGGTAASSDVPTAIGGATPRKRTGSPRWADAEERSVRRDASLKGLRRLGTGHVRRKEGRQGRGSAADSYRDEPEQEDEQLQEEALAADEGRMRSRTPINNTAVEDGDQASASMMQAPVASELRRARSRTPRGRRVRPELAEAEAEAEEVDEESGSRLEAPGRAKSKRLHRGRSAGGRQRSQEGGADAAEDSTIDQDYL
jgi:hypothetical protein